MMTVDDHEYHSRRVGNPLCVNGFNHSVLSITQESAHTCAPNLGRRRVQSVPTITMLTVLIFDRLNKTLLLGQKEQI